MANTATLMVKILGDASGAQKTLGKFAGTMEKAMIPAAAVGTALVAMGASAVKSASQLQQAQGAVDAVFGKSAKVVENYAKTSATRLGVSASEYMNSAALMGTALQNAGFSSIEAAKTSDAAWRRAADMAALYGGTGAEAMEAMNAAIARGEFEQLERYGVSLKADAINAELAARGQQNLTGEAKKNAQAQIVLDQIMQQSAKSAGQFARESDTVAVQQQKMAAQVENSMAAIGTGLLPIVAQVTGELAKLAGWAGKNATAVSIMAGAMAALVTAVFAINAGIKLYSAYTAAAALATKVWNSSTLILQARLIALAAAEKIVAVATKVWAVAMKLLRAAFLTSPIGWVVLGIMALVAAIIYAWKNSETFRKIVLTSWAAIKAASVAVFNFLKAFIMKIWGAVRVYFVTMFTIYRVIFTTAWRVIRSATTSTFNFIRSFIQKILGGIRAYFTTVLSIYRTIFTRAWNVIKRVTQAAFNAAKNYIIKPMNSALSFIRSIPGKARSGLSSLGSAVQGRFSSAFNGAKSRAVSILNSLVSFIRGIPGKAAAALSSIGSRIKGVFSGISLYNAGVALISSLTRGITAKIGDAVAAVQNGAKKIKDLWPGSPVKAGPLTAWNNGRAGKRLMAMLASGIEAGASEVQRAAEMAAYGINGGLTLGTTTIGAPQVNVSVPSAAPTIVEVHLDGQVIGRYVQKKVDASIGAQARRIVLGAINP